MADLEFIVDYSSVKKANTEIERVGSQAKKSAQVFERAFRKVEQEQKRNIASVRQQISFSERLRRQQDKQTQDNIKALDRQRQAAKAYNKETERLKLQYNSTYRAAQSFKGQLRDMNEAHRRGAISSDTHEQQVRQLKEEYRAFLNGSASGMNQFGQIASKNTRVMKRFGAVGMQQVGYQVQDFAVQVQSGTSAMVALGQQGSQLLGILGPAGAVAGAVLAVGTGLVGAFIETRRAAEEATKGVLSLEDALESLNDSAASYRSQIDQLRFGVDSREEARVLREINDLEEDFFKKRSRYADTDSLSTRQRLSEELRGLQERLSSLREEADAHREIREEYEAQLETQKHIKEMAEVFRAAQSKSQKESREQAQEEAEAAERIRAAYAEYYRERRSGEALIRGDQKKTLEVMAGGVFRLGESLGASVEDSYALAEAFKEGSVTIEQVKNLMDETGLSARRIKGALDAANISAKDLQGVSIVDAISPAVKAARELAKELGISFRMAAAMSGAITREDPTVLDPRSPRYDPEAARMERLKAQMESGELYESMTGSNSSSSGGGSVASGASAAADQVDRLNQALTENEKLMLSAGETISSSFGDALMSVVDGTKSAADAFRDMARRILKQAFDMLVVQPIMNSIMGAFSPGPGMSAGAASSIVSQLPQALVQANGGAWDKGVQMYANGGVVNGATAFSHSGGLGVMGEAGPEAIMPLKRGRNGKLGVQTDAPQGNITVENHFHVYGNGDEYIMNQIKGAAGPISDQAVDKIVRLRKTGSLKNVFG